MTVYSGTQKISMGRNEDTDYASKRAAAMAQAGQNQYIQGVQAGIAGVGKAVAADRTVYGNSNIPVGEILNPQGNFSYTDSPGNQPMADRANRTGSVDTQISSTNVPQQDPDEMETDALSNRLQMMAKGGQGFPGLNNRNREV
jgi:hypothetical protein